jgi:hypothetical protein
MEPQHALDEACFGTNNGDDRTTIADGFSLGSATADAIIVLPRAFARLSAERIQITRSADILTTEMTSTASRSPASANLRSVDQRQATLCPI